MKKPKTNDTIRGALARGYCSGRNGKKILDPDLIEDMAIEIEKFLPNEEEIDKIIREWCIQREDQVGVLTIDLAKAISDRIRGEV